MQLSIILSATMAILAAAAPQGVARGHGGGGGGDSGGGSTSTCNANAENQVCCNGILSCLVQVIGAGCETEAFCCETDAPIVRETEGSPVLESPSC